MASVSPTIADFRLNSSFQVNYINFNWTVSNHVSGTADKVFDFSAIPTGSTISSATLYSTTTLGNYDLRHLFLNVNGAGDENFYDISGGVRYKDVTAAIQTLVTAGTKSITIGYKFGATSSSPSSLGTGTKSTYMDFAGNSIVINYAAPYTNPTVTNVRLNSSTADAYVSSGSATLSWTGTNGNYNAISSYTIQYSDNGGGWVNYATGVTGSSYAVNAPAAGAYRTFAVTAIAPQGNSTAVASPKLYTYSLPTVSTVKVAGSTSNQYKLAGSTQALSWSASSGSFNTISSYTIYRSLNNGSYSTLASGVTGTSYSVTSSSTGGAYYTYRVVAVAPRGNSAGADSPKLYSFTNPTVTGVTLAGSSSNRYVASGSVTLAWTGNNGSLNAISNYDIYRSKDGGSYSRIVAATTSTSYSAASTSAGHYYRYYIVAHGALSNSAAAYSPYLYTYSAPTVSAVKLASSTSNQYRAASTSVTLSWSAANGSYNTIASYTVQRSLNGGSYGTWTGSTGLTSKTLTVTSSATAGAYYTYRVKAEAPRVDSAYATSPRLYTYSPVTKPTAVSVTPTTVLTNGSVSVAWSGASAGTGVSIIGYKVYRDGVHIATPTASPYSTTAPNDGGSYVYTVQAMGSVSGYDSAVSSASATLNVQYPSSDFTLNKTTVPMDGSTTITATIVPLNSGYSHVVKWYIDGTYHDENTVSAGLTTDTVSLPEAWAAAFVNSASSSCKCRVSTYNGEVLLGYKETTFTVTVPASVVPSVSLAVAPVDDFGGLYLKGISKCRCTVTSGGVYGSSISLLSVYGGGGSGSASPWDSPILAMAGSVGFTATVTDSRARQATDTENITVTDYNNPVISSVVVYRSDDEGNSSPLDGTYIYVKANATIESVSGNSITVFKVQYREVGSDTWLTGSDLAHNTGATFGGGLIDIAKSYELLFTLTDTVGKTGTNSGYIAPVQRMFDFRNDRGAIGRVAGDTKTLTIPEDWTTNIPVNAHDHDSAYSAIGHDHDSDYLGIGAQAADSDKLDGYHAAELRTGQNILHNWDFRNPINQRGVSGTVSASGYFIDRWYKYAAGEIVITSAGLNCGSVIEQRIEGTGLAGQTATFSIMIGGVIHAKTLTFPASTGSIAGGTNMPMDIVFFHDTTSMKVRLNAPPAALTYQAVKLEMGTASTLHLDPPMDWAVELPKCQRFYQVVDRLSSIYGHAQSSTLIRATMPLMSQMRIVPTLSHTNITVYGNGTQITGGAISGLALTSSGLRLAITGTGYPSGHVVAGRIGPSGETVFLTADL